MLLRECSGRHVGFASCLVVLTLLAAPIGDAHAEDVLPGFDLYTTDSGSTQFDFGVQPIAADFFGPGSDPFDGGVPASGLPLPQNPLWPLPPTLCVNDDLSAIDTIVERLGTGTLPSVGDSVTIPIEIVALSLTSSDPITVTYNGGLSPELWDVDIVLSSVPQLAGQMKLRRTHLDGGNFNSSLPVTPLLVFTRQSDSMQLFLDGGLEGLTYTLKALWVPWEYNNPEPLSCRSNFCVSNPFIETSLFAYQRLLPACAPVVPVMPGVGVIILVAALAGSAVVSSIRRSH